MFRAMVASLTEDIKQRDGYLYFIVLFICVCFQLFFFFFLNQASVFLDWAIQNEALQ